MGISQIVELPKEQTDKWIRLPSDFTKRPDAFMSPGRLAYCSPVEEAGKRLGVNYKNTSKDSLYRDFIGNNNWFESNRLNRALGADNLKVATPITREFVNFGNLLYQGINGKIKVYDKSGKLLDQKYLSNLFEDLFVVKSPFRAHFLDADFKMENGVLHLHEKHIFNDSGNIINYCSESLDKNTLMTDKTPGISLINFLTKNHTSQGFPNKNVQKGDFYYWPPAEDNDSVARFNAGSGGAGFYCGGNPSLRNSDLGLFSIARSE
jgi:hypothetical protein